MANSPLVVLGTSFAMIVGACSVITDSSGLVGEVGDAAAVDAATSLDAASSGDSVNRDSASRTYADVVLADAPLAYYRLDESAGPTLHDSSGHAKDASGAVGITFGIPGAIGGDTNPGVRLDGADCIHAGAEFDFAGRQPYSLEMWVKPEVIDDTFRMLFVKDSFNSGNKREEYGIYFYAATGLVFERYVQGDGIAVHVGTNVTGQWMHVVATYDGTLMSLYRDGKLVGAQPDERQQASKPVPANIGCSTAGAGVVKGGFDEVAVYDHALAPDRIAAHFAAAGAH